MARTIVEISRTAGNYRVDLGGQSTAQVLGAGASIGAAAGSIGIVTQGVGAAVGTTVAAIGRLFGLGSGRDEVRDVMRAILANAFGALLPGRMTVDAAGRVRLDGQYRPEDIATIIREIRNATLAELTPGSDIHTDLSIAFGSIEFLSSDGPGYEVLSFEPLSDASNLSTQHGTVSSVGTRRAQDGSGGAVDAGTLFGLSPTVAAVGLGLLVLIIARR